MNEDFISIKSNNRNTTIDCLKGIAIVFVVLGHIIDGNRAQNVIQGQWLDYLYNAIYLFHMPLFFLLSGMALHLSAKKSKKRWISSCLNMLILYLFWQIFYNTFRGVFSSVVNKSAADNIFLELLFPSTLYWYLITLFYYYLLYYLVLKKVKGVTLNIVWICSVLISALTPWVCGLFSGLGYMLGYIYKLFFHFTFFLSGYLLMERKMMIYNALQRAWWLPGIALVSLAIGAYGKYMAFPFVKSLSAFAAIAGLLYIVTRYKNISDNRILCYFGRNTIYVYLVHNYFTVALRTVYMKTGIVIPTIIYIIICLAVTLSLCSLIRFCCSRINILGVFFRPAKFFDKIIAPKVHIGEK